ncbi:MAG: VOC family protein [Alphaproteobacteria bacterium]|nr:VOC family protein [Alphaproteobacteria bacterium]
MFNSLQPFHLAFPVTDLAIAREFYGKVLDCQEGRVSNKSIVFNFFGHQLVAHLASHAKYHDTNLVDGDHVPIPHFGIVLTMDQWHHLVKKLQNAGAKFLIEPHIRFKGKSGEQATMFFLDPFGNALEFKAFNNTKGIFSK